MIATTLQVAGFACLVGAAWIVAPAAGLCAAGVSLLLIGHAADGAAIPRLRVPLSVWRAKRRQARQISVRRSIGRAA